MGAFSDMQNAIAKSMMKKGMSKDKAMKIGGAIAYKHGVKKYGKSVMAKAAKLKKPVSEVAFLHKRNGG
jgi:hypothetical protein